LNAIWNKYLYDKEKQATLIAWEEFLLTLLKLGKRELPERSETK